MIYLYHQKKGNKKMFTLILVIAIFFIGMFFVVKNDIHSMAKEEAEAMRNITEALLGEEEDEDDF